MLLMAPSDKGCYSPLKSHIKELTFYEGSSVCCCICIQHNDNIIKMKSLFIVVVALLATSDAEIDCEIPEVGISGIQ